MVRVLFAPGSVGSLPRLRDGGRPARTLRRAWYHTCEQLHGVGVTWYCVLEQGTLIQLNRPIVTHLCLREGSGREEIGVVSVCTGSVLGNPTVNTIAAIASIEVNVQLGICLV